MFQTTTERIALRSKLTTLFKECPVGSTVSHESIRTVTGLFSYESRAVVHSVLKALNENDGAVFTSVYGVGYQRMPTEALHEVGVSARRSVMKKTRRAQKTLINALGVVNEPEARRKLHTEVGMLGLIELAASNKMTKKVVETVDIHAETAPSAVEIATSMLEALRSH